MNPTRNRGAKDCINKRISDSGSKAQYKGDTGIHDVQDHSAYLVFEGPMGAKKSGADIGEGSIRACTANYHPPAS